MPPSDPSDSTDNQWPLLGSLLPDAKLGGRPHTIDLRAVIDAILHILCAGCPWRYLPPSYPNWKTAYHGFARWRNDRTSATIHERRRQWDSRGGERLPSSPSLALADRQTGATAPMVSQFVGYDGGKKVKGCKRNIAVESLGYLLVVIVTAANVSDGAGLRQWLAQVAHPGVKLTRLGTILVDGGYVGEQLVHWVMDTWGWLLRKVLRPQERRECVLVPQRWVVKRSGRWRDCAGVGA